jgi:hypothetical protein
LGLDPVEKHLGAASFLGERALLPLVPLDDVGDGNMGQNQLYVLLDDIAVLVEIISTAGGRAYMSKASLSLVSRLL